MCTSVLSGCRPSRINKWLNATTAGVRLRYRRVVRRRESSHPPHHLSAGVQNRTALADIAVKCSEITARGLPIAAESFPFDRADLEITARTEADIGCHPL
jgi:hypothetical protein